MILYLHGFRSSPNSFKARVMAARLTELGRSEEWCCPMLPVSPLETIALAESLVAAAEPSEVTVVGSSLGGYYATHLAEKHNWPAVLLNPAVVPQRDLSHYLGEQPLWHGGGSIIVEPHHLDELRALGVAAITRPERYYLIAATGDEVLDYREMLAHYLDRRQRPRYQRVRTVRRRRARLLRCRGCRAAGAPRGGLIHAAGAQDERGGSTTTNTLPLRGQSRSARRYGRCKSEREY